LRVKLSIDSATPRDAAALVVLQNRVADGMTREFGAGPWSAHTSAPQVLKQMRASQVLVARQGGDIIGTVRLITPHTHAFDTRAFTPVDRALYVLGLAVSLEFRNLGVGRQLLAAARQSACDRAAQALWLDAYEHAAGAGPFYLRCGFRKVGPAPGGEVPLMFYESVEGAG
jgi:GNAT superfamily N-acetyltransferase